MLDKSPESADDLIARMGAAAREAAAVLATAGSERKHAALIAPRTRSRRARTRSSTRMPRTW